MYGYSPASSEAFGPVNTTVSIALHPTPKPWKMCQAARITRPAAAAWRSVHLASLLLAALCAILAVPEAASETLVETALLEEGPMGARLPRGKVTPATPGALDELGVLVDNAPSRRRSARFAFQGYINGTRCGVEGDSDAGVDGDDEVVEGCTFQCQLDFAGWQTCDATEVLYDGAGRRSVNDGDGGPQAVYHRLEDGEHAFYVRTVAPDGVSVDETPAYYYWMVYSDVETAIVGHPAMYTREGPFEFEMESNKVCVIVSLG